MSSLFPTGLFRCNIDSGALIPLSLIVDTGLLYKFPVKGLQVCAWAVVKTPKTKSGISEKDNNCFILTLIKFRELELLPMQ